MADESVRIIYESNLSEYRKELEGTLVLNEKLEKEIDQVTQANKRQAKSIDLLEKEIRTLTMARDKAFDPETVAKYNRQIEKSQKQLQDLKSKGLDQVQKAGSRVSAVFGKIAIAAAGAFSIQQVARFASEAVDLAAKAEGIRTAFSRLDDPGLLDDLRAATRGTVTDVELMRQAVRAENFKVPLDQLATFFEFATIRSAQTGESVDYLVNSIIDGIGRKSTLVMDNLGISASELQEEIKKTGDFGQAAGNIIAREMANAGEVAMTSAQELAAMNAELENTKEELGRELVPIQIAWNKALSTTVGGFNDLIQVINDGGPQMHAALNIARETIEQTNNAVAQGKADAKAYGDSYRENFTDAGLSTEQLKESLTKLAEEQRVAAQTARDQGDAMSAIRYDAAAEGLLLYIDGLDKMNEKSETQPGSIKSLEDRVKELTEVYKNAAIGTDEFTQAEKDLEQAKLDLAIATREETEQQKKQKKELEELERKAKKLGFTSVESYQNWRESMDQVTTGFIKLAEVQSTAISLTDVYSAEVNNLERELKDLVPGTQAYIEKTNELNKALEKQAILQGVIAGERPTDEDLGIGSFDPENLDLTWMEELRSQFKGIFEGGDIDWEKLTEAAQEGFNQVLNIYKDLTRSQTEANLNRINLESQAEIDALRERLNQGIITEQQFADEKLKIENELDDKQKALLREQAEREKRLAIFEAIINGALAVVKALPDPISVALAVAATAAQVAVIAATPIPEFAEGGDILGPSHAGGGVPLIAEGGEHITKKSVMRGKYGPLIRAFNKEDDNLVRSILEKEFALTAVGNGGIPVVNVNSSFDKEARRLERTISRSHEQDRDHALAIAREQFKLMRRKNRSFYG